MNRPPSRRPYGQKSTARPPSRRPYGQQRAKSTAADKPRVTPKPGMKLDDLKKSYKKSFNMLPPVAAVRTTAKFGRDLGTFLGKQARKILQIPKGKGVDTKYRGVR